MLAYHCCQWDDGEKFKPARFVRSIAAMIAGKLEAYAAILQHDATVQESLSAQSCEADPGSALENGILVPLERLHAPAGGPRYLLIDALDEALLAPPGAATIVDILATRLVRLPAWLRLVATTRKEPNVLARLSGLRAEELDAQAPENLDDVRQFIDMRLETPNLAECLTHARVKPAQVRATLLAQSAGNFLYVQQALEALETGGLDVRQLEKLPPGLAGLYENRFARQFPGEGGFAGPKQVLEVLLAAEEPLTERQLAAATGLDADEQLPAVLQRLAAYLPRRLGEDQVARYAVYHKSLTDWLTDPQRRGLLYSASPKRGHQRLAEACWVEYQRGPQRLSRYPLAYLPAHLIGAERWEDLETLLMDLFYLEAKTKAGRVFDLADDFTAAAQALPEDRPRRRLVQLLEEGLRRDIHFIARHARYYPQGLFQCLWNTCWWYDCPEAAIHYDLTKRTGTGPLPWERSGERLAGWLERWRQAKERAEPGFVWLRSLRPPKVHLGTGQKAVFRGHEKEVRSVAFSPNGLRLASGSEDKTVRIWNAATGAELLCLRGHQDHVNSVAFAPDGRRLASGSRDATVRMWDTTTGAELLCLRGRKAGVETVALSPDGQRLASGSDDYTVRMWDTATGAELLCLRGHERPVASAAFSRDGRRLASASMDKTLCVWDAATGAELLCLRGHEATVWSVAFAPDGRRLASGSEDNTVRVWDAATGGCLHVLQGLGDVDAIAAGSSRYPWIALGQKLETVIQEGECLQPLAWFPEGPYFPITHRSGRMWADNGAALRLFSLEGDSKHHVSPDSSTGESSP